uniref:PDZ domain-containing protein n=1 Tax=Panagrellus redivivus TaxID=6233 RepID=A0A7E4W297_PANRE
MKLRLTSLHRNANGMYENSTKKSKNDKYNGLTAHSLQKPAVVASIQRSQVGTPEAMHVSVTRCRLEDASGLTFKLKDTMVTTNAGWRGWAVNREEDFAK